MTPAGKRAVREGSWVVLTWIALTVLAFYVLHGGGQEAEWLFFLMVGVVQVLNPAALIAMGVVLARYARS